MLRTPHYGMGSSSFSVGGGAMSGAGSTAGAGANVPQLRFGGVKVGRRSYLSGSRRFTRQYRRWVEKVLSADPNEDAALDAELRNAGQSLRVLVREIPPVFGDFY